MAQRAIWSGAISFGLINVPVKLYSGVTERTIRFNQINEATGNRIKMPKVDAVTGKEVPFEQIVKGFEYTPERYIIVAPDELEALAPKKAKTIELEKFVLVDQIDPMLYDSSYYLGPDAVAMKAYKMLVQAMSVRDYVAIGKIIIRSKERLVAVRALDNVLVLSTLVFADEVNNAHALPNMDVQAEEPSDREVQMAASLITALAGEFEHHEYRDEYREQVEHLIESKAAGEPLPAGEGGEPVVSTGDLVAALEASLAVVKAETKPARKPPARKRAPARKRTTTKAKV